MTKLRAQASGIQAGVPATTHYQASPSRQAVDGQPGGLPAREPPCHARCQSAASRRPRRDAARSRASEQPDRRLGSPYGQRQASGASAQTFSAVVGPGSAKVESAKVGSAEVGSAEVGSAKVEKAAALTSATTDCSGAGATKRGAAGSGSAPPFVRTGTGMAACSTRATVTVPAASKRSTMPTPHGVLRSPRCQRRTLRGPTPNNRAT